MIYRLSLDSSSGKLEVKEPPSDSSISFEEFFRSFTPDEVKAKNPAQATDEAVGAVVETLMSVLQEAFSQIEEKEEEEDPECLCDTCESQSPLSVQILEVGYSQLDEFTRLSDRASELEDENEELKKTVAELQEKIEQGNRPPSSRRAPFPDASLFSGAPGSIFLL